MRNVLIAIGNSADRTLATSAENLLNDPSPLVRGAAVWALSRLLAEAQFEALRTRHMSSESEPTVAEEWRAD